MVFCKVMMLRRWIWVWMTLVVIFFVGDGWSRDDFVCTQVAMRCVPKDLAVDKRSGMADWQADLQQ